MSKPKTIADLKQKFGDNRFNFVWNQIIRNFAHPRLEYLGFDLDDDIGSEEGEINFSIVPASQEKDQRYLLEEEIFDPDENEDEDVENFCIDDTGWMDDDTDAVLITIYPNEFTDNKRKSDREPIWRDEQLVRISDLLYPTTQEEKRDEHTAGLRAAFKMVGMTEEKIEEAIKAVYNIQDQEEEFQLTEKELDKFLDELETTATAEGAPIQDDISTEEMIPDERSEKVDPKVNLEPEPAKVAEVEKEAFGMGAAIATSVVASLGAGLIKGLKNRKGNKAAQEQEQKETVKEKVEVNE